MKNTIGLHLRLFLGLVLLSVSTLAQAQEETDGVATIWHIVVEDGMDDNFEAAIKQYHEFMADKPGRWSWTFLNAVTGANQGDYFARSGSHNWADLDATHEWDEEASEHFEMHVAPYIKSATRTITVEHDVTNYPENWEEINFVNTTEWHIAPGKFGEFEAHLNKVHENLMAANWSGTYAFNTTVSGGMGDVITLATFHKNWADMKEPSPNFMEVLSERMGQKETVEMMSAFGATFTSGKSTTYRIRPDLSY